MSSTQFTILLIIVFSIIPLEFVPFAFIPFCAWSIMRGIKAGILAANE